MKGTLFAFLSMISYSSTPTFTNYGLNAGMKLNALLFLRHFIGLILYIPTMVRLRGTYNLDRGAVRGLIIMMLTGVVVTYAYNYGYALLPSVIGTVSGLSYIVFVFAIEIVLGREKMTGRTAVIFAITIISLLVIAIPGYNDGVSIKGLLSVLLGAVIFAAQVCYTNSKDLKNVPSDVIVIVDLLPVVLTSFIAAISNHETLIPENIRQWVSVLCLASVGIIIARGLFFKAVRIIGATRTSLIDALEPFSAAVLAFFLNNQTPSLYTIIGSVLMTASIIMLITEQSKTGMQGIEPVKEGKEEK